MKKSFFILIFFCLVVEARPPSIRLSDEIWRQHEINVLQNSEMSLQVIKIALELEGIINQDYVIAQIKHETGHLTSDLCIKSHNLCGMKFPKIRETTAIGKDKNNYAIYNSWYDCVVDIGLWQQYYISKGRDLSNYPAFLASAGLS